MKPQHLLPLLGALTACENSMIEVPCNMSQNNLIQEVYYNFDEIRDLMPKAQEEVLNPSSGNITYEKPSITDDEVYEVVNRATLLCGQVINQDEESEPPIGAWYHSEKDQSQIFFVTDTDNFILMEEYLEKGDYELNLMQFNHNIYSSNYDLDNEPQLYIHALASMFETLGHEGAHGARELSKKEAEEHNDSPCEDNICDQYYTKGKAANTALRMKVDPLTATFPI